MTRQEAAKLIQGGIRTIEEIAAETGWPVECGVLIPEPKTYSVGNYEESRDLDIEYEADCGRCAAKQHFDAGKCPSDGGLFSYARAWRRGINADGEEIDFDGGSFQFPEYDTDDGDEPSCLAIRSEVEVER